MPNTPSLRRATRRRFVIPVFLCMLLFNEDCYAWSPYTSSQHRHAGTSLSASIKSKVPSSYTRGLEDYVPYETVTPRQVPDVDVSAGAQRPGAIIESEEQLERKKEILQEIRDGTRSMDDVDLKEFSDEDPTMSGTEMSTEGAVDGDDDAESWDPSTWATWTIQDLKSRFPYEWEPGQVDPNLEEMNREGVRYLNEVAKDEDGVEIGYDPMFGPSNPMDTRAIRGVQESYMVEEKTRNKDLLTPQFHPDDLEVDYNEDIVQFRRSLDIMETYIDPFLPEDMEVPRHVAKWHGYPETMYFKPQNYTNNRFTPEGTRTKFDHLTPHEARTKAVELARAKNAEWMTEEVSHKWHTDQRQPYEDCGTMVGTLRRAPVDPELVEAIQPVLRVLGSCVELLSIENETVFRFHYHGLMKNKHGMKAWTETMIRDCGVEVTGVVFETGFRRRDPAYDGGDPWNGPHN